MADTQSFHTNKLQKLGSSSSSSRVGSSNIAFGKMTWKSGSSSSIHNSEKKAPHLSLIRIPISTISESISVPIVVLCVRVYYIRIYTLIRSMFSSIHLLTTIQSNPIQTNPIQYNYTYARTRLLNHSLICSHTHSLHSISHLDALQMLRVYLLILQVLLLLLLLLQLYAIKFSLPIFFASAAATVVVVVVQHQIIKQTI